MMARLQDIPGHEGRATDLRRGIIELVVFGAVAFAVILLIAASSLSLEPRTVQPTANGEVLPIRVVAEGTR